MASNLELQLNSNPDSTDLRLAFVGGGQMAGALIKGLLAAGWPADRITVVEPDESQRDRLRSTLQVKAIPAGSTELCDAEVVVWAVKPQVLRQAISETVPFLSTPLHISIAAGVRASDIAIWAASSRVVRVMPNMSATVGAGVAGLLALDGVGNVDKALVERILRPTGFSFWVDSEDRLDAVTAISGSGPAYVFYFMEAFQKAAERAGFDSAQARDLVLRTVSGAVAQAKQNDAGFSTLREKVTSQRGTTEAALAVLEGAGWPHALGAAVEAAQARAFELSNEFGNPGNTPVALGGKK
ncbi:Pyrroline-5-carboxylate reductase [Burkholderiales bacterium 8X]|nr:Pyrroline-5-carboxylate reductase [Burkholderiales bacterium 8X]